MEDKKFKFTHLFFATEDVYIQQEMPSWITSKEYKWFLDDHVLTLDVGGFVETDFQRITRIK